MAGNAVPIINLAPVGRVSEGASITQGAALLALGYKQIAPSVRSPFRFNASFRLVPIAPFVRILAPPPSRASHSSLILLMCAVAALCPANGTARFLLRFSQPIPQNPRFRHRGSAKKGVFGCLNCIFRPPIISQNPPFNSSNPPFNSSNPPFALRRFFL